MDADKDGLFKIRRVQHSDDIDDVIIRGINKLRRTIIGWIPHFIFDHKEDNGIEIQVAKIQKEYYGKSLDLGW